MTSYSTTKRSLICEVAIDVPDDVLQFGETDSGGIIRTFGLPEVGEDAMVLVNVVRSEDSYSEVETLFLEVRVQGVPSHARVLIQGIFHRKCRSWYDNEKDVRLHDALRCKELRGSGLLTSCILGFTLELTGTVSVYSLRKPLVNHMKFLSTARQHEAFRDVVLRVAGSEFPAHKLVLCSASSVFLGMFTGAFEEAKAKEVELTHTCSAAVFSMFLDVLYTGELPDVTMDVTDLVQLLELGSHYMVDLLKEEVTLQLMKMNAKDAMAIIITAMKNPVVPEKVLGRAFDIALGDKDNAMSIIATSLESQVVPEDVLIRALSAASVHWDTIAASPAWATFQEAYPSVATVLKAVARARLVPKKTC